MRAPLGAWCVVWVVLAAMGYTRCAACGYTAGESSRPGGDLPHCIASLSARTQTKPTTYQGYSQRKLLASIQIVVVDSCTRGARRKERAAAAADLSTSSATRCRQGISQLLRGAANGDAAAVDVPRDFSLIGASRDTDPVITAVCCGAIVDSSGEAPAVVTAVRHLVRSERKLVTSRLSTSTVDC